MQGILPEKPCFRLVLPHLFFGLLVMVLFLEKIATFLSGCQNSSFQADEAEGSAYSSTAFFVFQLAFAGISLAVAFGGFAERAKLSVYLVFAILFSSLVYPVIAHWIWGGGWLASHGKQILQALPLSI